MLGSFLTRGLVLAFGYVYPAYECYKTVEKNKPEIDQLRFWCQYWILIACLAVFERFGDAFVSWVPMYCEAKLAFVIFLWCPKTMGTTYVYDSFFRPYVAKHENEIDQNLLELRTRAGDVAVIYWQRALSYGQTRIFDILQYVAAQSASRPQPPQQQQRPGARQPPSAPKRQAAPKPQLSSEEPPSPTSSTSSSQDDDNAVTERGGLSETKKTINKTILNVQDARIVQSAQIIKDAQSDPVDTDSEKSEESVAPTKAEQMKTETVIQSEKANGAPIETVMEETIRVARVRLRKTRSMGTK